MFHLDSRDYHMHLGRCQRSCQCGGVWAAYRIVVRCVIIFTCGRPVHQPLSGCRGRKGGSPWSSWWWWGDQTQLPWSFGQNHHIMDLHSFFPWLFIYHVYYRSETFWWVCLVGWWLWLASGCELWHQVVNLYLNISVVSNNQNYHIWNVNTMIVLNLKHNSSFTDDHLNSKIKYHLSLWFLSRCFLPHQ